MDLRPRVLLTSFPTSLGLSLVDNLISNYCNVTIYSNEVDLWKQKAFYLKENKYFSVSQELVKVDFSYFIIDFKSLLTLDNWKEDLEIIYKNALSKNAKILFIAPAVLEKPTEKLNLKFVKDFFQSYELFSLIFVGETFGPRMEMEESFVSIVIYQAIGNRTLIQYDKDFYIYPTFSPFLAKKIVKEVFSFTNPDGGVLFLSTQIKYSELLQMLKQFLPDCEIVFSSENLIREAAAFNKKFLIEANLKRVMEETLEWFNKFPPKIIKKIEIVKKIEIIKPEIKKIEESPKVVPKQKIIKDRKLPKAFLKAFLLPLVVIVLTPLFLLLLSLTTFYASVKRIEAGDFSKAKIFLTLTSKSASLAQKENEILSSIPILGPAFSFQKNVTGLLLSTSNTASQAATILEDSSHILSSVLKKDNYDLAQASGSLGVRLDSLYKDLSFLEGDIKSAGIFNVWIQKVIKEKKLSEIRQEIFLSKNIFYKLPTLLGVEKKTTYLVLFQNNMELRPTGGFIGSFGLVTFEKGSLISFEVRDVYEADGALKGHVEPPMPIKKYLGEAGWYLRDSNWDSDFPASALKAEWFLGKELNKQVDGVVAIDLNVVSELLKVLGPVYLPDYNKEITSENLYKEVQSEAEENFFPGSQQKRNILTALSRQLMQKLTELDSKKHLGVAKVIYQSLRQKHVLVFLHDREAGNSFRDMGFDGAVSMGSCQEDNCYADTVAVVEANLGVNKGNYKLKRSMKIGIELAKDSIKRNLTINYFNTDRSGELNRSYKAYSRVLMPLDSEVESLFINGSSIQDFDLVETQGRKELGFWVETPPLTASEVLVNWKSPLNLNYSKNGVYKLYFRKQPGTLEDPLSLSIKSEVPLTFEEEKGVVFLTKVGEYVYNMLLAEDLNAFARWK